MINPHELGVTIKSDEGYVSIDCGLGYIMWSLLQRKFLFATQQELFQLLFPDEELTKIRSFVFSACPEMNLVIVNVDEGEVEKAIENALGVEEYNAYQNRIRDFARVKTILEQDYWAAFKDDGKNNNLN